VDFTTAQPTRGEGVDITGPCVIACAVPQQASVYFV
jgi:hypothetical protein